MSLNPRSRALSMARRAALALLFFVAVYGCAFGVAFLLRPGVEVLVPLLIVVSAGVALLIMALFPATARGIGQFGIAPSPLAYLVAAVVLGVVVGGAFAWLSARYPAPAPIDTSKFPLWMIVAYFVVGAPIQEELIFRGLLQTTLAPRVSSGGFWEAHFPVAFVALLFAVVHLGSGPVVVTGALFLGAISGELRRMSGSLLPAIIVHALFNAASALIAPG